ncbi:MAG: amidohydrolase family protein [Hyphomicrobiaceae bacterium]|jgi:predicted TIM-barrel fold metal-dependent hydrolase
MSELYDDLPIVDAHHHLWDLERDLTYPWMTNAEHAYMGDNSSLRRTYLPDEYRRDTALHNVIATVHIEAECDRSRQVDETRWLTGIAAAHGMPNAIVAHVWVDTPDSEEILIRQKAFPLVRGIRTKPIISKGPGDSVRGEPRSLQDPKWRNGLSLLEKHDLSWDLRVPWWHLEEAAEVVREHPGLRIVLNHTGYPLDRSPEALAVWRRGMAALAASPNVHCKISGLTVLGAPWTLAANKPIIREAISIFGVDRCMFASNFPVDGLKGSWDYLYSCFKKAVADLPLADRRRLFADNALAFYRITRP